MKPKALILQARGTNRDTDVSEALRLAGADPEIVPLNYLRAGKRHFLDYQMLVVAGGFSYADALGAGKLLGIDLQVYFSDEINVFVETGKPVIGICNGFQALVKSGILPGGNARAIYEKSVSPQSFTTLTFNAVGHFECRWVTLKPVSQLCVWTQKLDQLIECPVAHGEGNFQVADAERLKLFVGQDQIALTYVREDGTPATGEYPINPNGSVLDIAGICNQSGNVLGLMPHPENHIYAYQHPQRARGIERYSGLALFQNGVMHASAI